MDQFLAYNWNEIPYVAITLMIAFSLHEFAHAYVAYKFGDMTAKKQGRLTLNPLQHLDPLGTLFIFIAGFGWARPVPVNRYFFKKPRLAGVLVSLAGPLSNLLLVILAIFIWYSLMATGIASGLPSSVPDFLNIFISLNALLFIFNLLPFPPLDGYRIIEDLAPVNIRAKMTQYEQYGALIFLIIIFTPLDQYTIHPIINTVTPNIVQTINQFFYQLLMN
ncbi:site-2 protease family protein [Bacillus massilinigeriensis]|uniref:site-2 protease family protein n=1 Tax=Bacillus massilionigeriensis TaxID=1805475 RepID=UPI00096AEA92|nr:site-2 protease family protein [Bacillus massilionigeriensis]